MWSRIFTTAFTFFTVAASAQFGNPQLVTREEKETDYLATADMDNDGDIDLVAMGSIAVLVIYENAAGGGFSKHLLPGPTASISWLQLLDMDHDGFVDIVAGHNNNPRITWWHNLGGLLFEAEQASSISQSLPYLLDHDIVFADVNGDGAIDALYKSGLVRYCELNDGNGQFLAPYVMNIGGYFNLLDFDGDGDMDILASINSMENQCWRNENNGTFTHVGDINEYNAFMGVADVDGDGKDDLFHNVTGVWYKSLGDGTFTALSGFPELFGTIAVQDINNDGFQDLVAVLSDVGVTPTGMSVAYGTGNGAFEADLNVDARNPEFSKLLLADMDGDGRPEILTTWNQFIFQYKVSDDGTIAFDQAINESLAGFTDLLSADLNMDGLVDVVRFCGQFGMAFGYVNNGPAGFAEPTILFALPDVVQDRPYIADVDNDGYPDIIVISRVSSASGRIRIFRNEGDLNFTELSWTGPSVWLNPAFVFAVADLTGDGHPDLLTYEANGSSICRWRNMPPYTGSSWQMMTAISPVLDGETRIPVGLEDIDGDGDRDLVFYNNGPVLQPGRVEWMPNTGNMNFGPKQTLAIGGGLGYMEMLDMDGDGDLDVVLLAPILSWSENMGSATFGPFQQLATPPYPASGYMALDLDHDGFPDFINMAPDQGSSWQRNNGDGTVAPPQPLAGTEGFVPWGYTALSTTLLADFDADGDGDILYSTEFTLAPLVTRRALVLAANHLSDPYHLTGTVYGDLNGNGTRDASEPGLPGAVITASPTGYVALGDSLGDYMVYSTSGLQSVTAALDQPLWALSSTPSTFTVEPISAQPDWPGLDFGFAPVVDTSLIEPIVVLSPATCGDTTSLWVTIQNEGTRVEHGTITLHLDPLFSFQGSNPAPLSTAGSMITWAFDSLDYFAMQEFHVQVGLPQASHIGEAYVHTLTVSTLDDQSIETGTFVDSLTDVVSCAYDPNDKLVDPKGYGAFHAVPLTTDELAYTVRFQNTGNDTATDVVLRDFLDTALQAGTLHLMGASHTPTAIGIEPSGELVVRFNNIQLVDSGTSFTGSQGFIKFRVRLQPGLQNMAQVHNTAHILFDLNPPVVTNTALTTLVDCNLWNPEITSVAPNVLEATSGDAYQWFLNGEELDGDTAQTLLMEADGTYMVEVTNVYGCTTLSPAFEATLVGLPELGEPAMALVPNPFHGHTMLLFGDVMTAHDRIQIVDVNGSVVQELRGTGTRTRTINCHGLASGLYVLRVLCEGKAPASMRLVVE